MKKEMPAAAANDLVSGLVEEKWDAGLRKITDIITTQKPNKAKT